ncbi:MAG: flippase [Lachnospiraceae bacterium]
MKEKEHNESQNSVIEVKEKSLKLNAMLNTIKTILGIIFPLITFPYISRILSVSSIGSYNVSSSVISYFLLIAGLGVSTYAIREGTQYRNDYNKMELFTSEVFSINMYSTIISYFALIISILCFPVLQTYIFFLVILSIQIFFATIGTNWLCNIYEDYMYITIRTLAFQIISLILMFVFVRDEKDIYIYLIIVTAANCVPNLINYLYIRKKYVKIKFLLKFDWKKHIKPILIIFSTSITITLYVNSDMTILGVMTSNYQVGLYSASVKIYTIVKNIMVSIVMVLIPRFSILFSKNNSNEASILFSKVVNSITLLLFPATIGMAVLSEDIVLLLAGNNYIEAGQSLCILSVATVFALYAYMYTNCILIPMKKEKIVFIASLISAVVNILLNIILIPYFGINAAALTTVLAEAIICFVTITVGRRFLKMQDVTSSFLKVLLGCVVIIVFCMCIKKIIISRIIRIIASVAGSIILYLFVVIFTKHSVLTDIWKKR